jgi:hypothetical protein
LVISDGATIALALLLSGGAFFGGGRALTELSRHDLVHQALDHAAKKNEIGRQDARFLNMRIEGYSARAATKHWQILRTSDELARAEKSFLHLDLFFPLVYGAGLLGSLWMVWRALGRPVPIGWLIAPVVIGMAADWIENVVQLRQLSRFLGSQKVQTGWMTIASGATTLKLVFLLATVLLLGLGLITLAARILKP